MLLDFVNIFEVRQAMHKLCVLKLIRIYYGLEFCIFQLVYTK